MYIKDLQTGKIRKYGTDRHDSLLISEDGRTLEYKNLQNGDGSRYGDYRFTDEKGIIHEIDNYFNIGGFIITENKVGTMMKKINRIKNKLGLLDLKEEAAKWVKKNLGEDCVEEFLKDYDSLNRGIPIGSFEETVIFLEIMEQIKRDIGV